MVEEDYCSYEIAKLLKEKGFDGECIGCYWDSKKIFDINYEPLSYSDGDLRDEVIIAPTHQMAMKWLREVYNVHIVIEYYEADGEGFYGWIVKTGSERYHCHQEFSITYEEAVEAALNYCLTKLDYLKD